jgi:hypothetical protein
LNNYSVKLETEDLKAEMESCDIPTSSSSDASAVDTTFPADIATPSQVQSYPLTDKGLKGYWRDKNGKSIDGLLGVSSGFTAQQKFSPIPKPVIVEDKDIERVELASVVRARSLKGGLSRLGLGWEQEKNGVVLGFVFGALAVVVAQRAISVLAGILIAQ